jgi:two-component system response regulator
MILLVEDNEDDEVLTLRAFRKNKILNKVVITRTGEEALDFLFGAGPYAGRDPAIVPLVMLLDLNLPKIGGIEVLRRIRADDRTRRLRVVVLTSSKHDEDALAGYALGAHSHVRKPVNFSDLADAVKPLGLFWLLRDDIAPVTPLATSPPRK